MTCPSELSHVIESFSSLDWHGFNETQTRVAYINPLFEALGWDCSGSLRPGEVRHEDRLRRPDGQTKHPDYGFYLRTQRAFFVEAKKPGVNLDTDPAPAFQIRFYAWKAGLSVSVLTDFEGLHVYDCRSRPQEDDDPRGYRLASWHFEDYVQKWSEISSVLSREAVAGGSLQRLLGTPKTPIVTVDEAFLEDLTRWRKLLAEALWAHNELREDQLPERVQTLLDRLVFLRIAEDRGTEDRNQLLHIAQSEAPYPLLLALFKEADAKYNSGLFHCGPEARDADYASLQVPADVLSGIIAGLYAPAPYDFAIMPVEVLGHAYERFLGDTIVVRDDVPVIEQKPEVRKAGGVYYTPEWVVEEMVEWTLGPLLKGKRPGEVAKLRFLDPACGSGTFLVGLYRYLLRWHLAWYASRDPQSRARGKHAVLFRSAEGDWRLRLSTKKEILQNNIFGLDIDGAGVDVAKLSLLLVVLEGEAEQVAQKSLFSKRLLPDLSPNIRCGNALVGTDIAPIGSDLFGDAERLADINPFDWDDPKSGFGAVLPKGRFDLVIGNPPYLSYSGRQAVDPGDDLRDYWNEHYDFSGWPTAHGLFIQRAVEQFSARFVSFIVPDQVGHLDGYAPTRGSVDTASSLRQVRYWGEHVFRGVITPSLSFVADKKHRGAVEICMPDGDSSSLERPEPGSAWRVVPGAAILKAMRADAWYLDKEVGDPGVHTGNCSKLLIHKQEDRLPGDLPVLEGKQVFRYRCEVPKKVLRANYTPVGKEYFRVSKEERYSAASFVIRQTAPYPIVGPRRHATHFRNSLLALYAAPSPLETHYVVGLLNSSLLRFAYRAMIQEAQQRTFPQVKVKSLRALPLKKINPDCAQEQAAHDHIASHVGALLDLQERLEAESSTRSAEVLRRQIHATDRTLDLAIFDLYGLDEDDRDEVKRLLDSWET